MRLSRRMAIHSARKAIVIKPPDFKAAQGLTQLSTARTSYAYAATEKHAIIAGGWDASYTAVSTVDVYLSTMVKGTANNLPQARTEQGAASIGEYILFGGGRNASNSDVAQVYSYNASLVRATATALTTSRSNMETGTTGKHALYMGGIKSGASNNVVDTYSDTLVRGTAAVLRVALRETAAVSSGGTVYLGGGRLQQAGQAFVAYLQLYTQELVRMDADDMHVATSNLSAAHTHTHLLLAGGETVSAMSEETAVTPYAKSNLVKGNQLYLSLGRKLMGAASLAGHAVFVGGSATVKEGQYNMIYGQKKIDIFSATLVRVNPPDMGLGRIKPITAVLSERILIGGGVNPNPTEVVHRDMTAYTI